MSWNDRAMVYVRQSSVSEPGEGSGFGRLLTQAAEGQWVLVFIVAHPDKLDRPSGSDPWTGTAGAGC